MCIFAPELVDQMTAQKPIANDYISDAFLSKNADGNYLSSDCFYARCKNITGFPFTGKEKDPETGYSYFGARYLEHELTAGWLSVDPMADKYPSLSPYAYCAWNPVRLIDPDGKKIRGVKYNASTDTYTFTRRAQRNGTYCFVNELAKTPMGRNVLKGLMESHTKYRVRVTGMPLFGASYTEEGKFVQFRGRYVKSRKTIWISTANKIADSESIKLVKGYFFDPMTDDWTKQRINGSDIVSNYTAVPNEYIKAYQDSGMEEFEQNPENQYRSPEEIIHGRGVHEGSHALQDQDIDNYSNEYEAFSNELLAREQYKEAVP